MLQAAPMRIFRAVWNVIFRLTGHRLAVKTDFQELGLIRAGFLAPSELIAQRLSASRFKPVEYKPGKCLVTIGAFQMRRSKSIQPYNEVGVEVPVIYANGQEAIHGGYVFWLPETSEDARWAGVEIYGLPKFLADIQFADQAEWRTVILREGGKEILRLEVPKLPTAHSVDVRRYLSTMDQTVLCTLMQFIGATGRRDEGCQARLQLGDHPIADQLRQLSLDPIPVFEEFADPLSLVLHKPVTVGQLA